MTDVESGNERSLIRVATVEDLRDFRKNLLGEQTQVVKHLEATTYDALFLALCIFEDSSLENHFWVWYQLLFTFSLQLLCCTIQLMMTAMLFASVVEKAEAPYEDGLPGHLTEILGALANQTKLEGVNASVLLCRRDQTFPHSHMMVLLLWLSRMLREIIEGVQTARMYHSVLPMPPPPEHLPQDHCEIIVEDIEVKDGEIVKEVYAIKYLSARVRWFAILFLGIMKSVVAIFLTYTSAKYLYFSDNMANVILKAVSMQFIVTLDEILYKAFIPPTFGKKIKGAKILYAGTRPTLWQQWGGSTTLVCIAIILIFLIRHVFFFNLQRYREACREYYTIFPEERDMLMNPVAAVSQAFLESFARL